MEGNAERTRPHAFVVSRFWRLASLGSISHILSQPRCTVSEGWRLWRGSNATRLYEEQCWRNALLLWKTELLSSRRVFTQENNYCFLGTEKSCGEIETCEEESSKDEYFRTGQTFLQSSAQAANFHDELKKKCKKRTPLPRELPNPNLLFLLKWMIPFPSRAFAFPPNVSKQFFQYQTVVFPREERQNLHQGNPGHAGTQTLPKHWKRKFWCSFSRKFLCHGETLWICPAK